MKTRTRKQASLGGRWIVGLDISLNATGLCLAHGDPRSQVGNSLDVDSVVIRTGKDLRGPERLSVVSADVWDWLQARQPARAGDLYVTEGYAFSRQQAHSLGEIGGCIRKRIWESGGNLIVIPPSTLKKYLTGKGAGDKNIVMKHVFKRWGFDVDEDNQCDAFGCAMLGLVASVDDSCWTGLEKDILKKKVQRYAGKGQKGWAGPVLTKRQRSKAEVDL